MTSRTTRWSSSSRFVATLLQLCHSASRRINFTDQAFYFRARNGFASLTISPDSIVTQDRDACAFVEMEAPQVTLENPSLSPAQINQMISDLIKIYLKEAVRAHASVFYSGDMDRLAG